jgi:glycogen(starch) synthase
MVSQNVLQLARLLDTVEPAVIHAHAGVPSLACVLARAASHSTARLVGQMYSWGPDRPEWMNLQDTWGLGQADRVVCSARAYQQLLVDYGVPARKLVYLPWGLPLDQLQWTAPANSAPSRAAGPRIGFVGRIEPRKGQLALVRAFAVLRRRYWSAALELVGPVADDAYAREVKTAVTAAHLEDAVSFAGQVRDVAARVRAWDLFVSLSDDEGQGLAVLEAMALGVPVLTRLVAGVSDFVRDRGTGFVLPSAAPRTVAASMAAALGDASLRQTIAIRARRLVERRYAWERTTAAFDSLYWNELSSQTTSTSRTLARRRSRSNAD